MKAAASLTILLATFSVTSSADNNYHVTCLTDPGVGVIGMRSGKVKGHLASASSRRHHCLIACTREFNPVCGSDGTTHGNECALCAAACRDHSLYLACRGECPCPVTAELSRGDPGVVGDDARTTDGRGGGVLALLPQSIEQQPQQEMAHVAVQNGEPKTKGSKKLKKNPNPVVIVTNIDLSLAPGVITADALNHVTLDLHAEMAPESNPVTQTSLWVVELYHKGKGRSPKQGFVHQALSPAQSGASLEVGQHLDIRAIEYELDLRGKTCADAAKICAHLRHQRIGKRRAKVIGKPTAKVLRRCAKVKCQAAGPSH